MDSSAAQLRRASLEHSHSNVLSPVDSANWDYTGVMTSDGVSAGDSSGPYRAVHPTFMQRSLSAHHQNPNHFHRPNALNAQQHFVPSWPADHANTHDGAESMTFSNAAMMNTGAQIPHQQQRPEATVSAQMVASQPSYPFPSQDNGFVPNAHGHPPMSPHSHQDWMTMAQQEVEFRPMPRRQRPSSPPRTTVDMQRNNGIRKRNGRIDIPTERNISNIDGLIEQATDEDQLKELKQQKRLLRNREAALASRQRKKRHTEELEAREKDFSRAMDDQNARLKRLEMELQRRNTAYEVLLEEHQASLRDLRVLSEDKLATARRHEEETAQLRRKVNYLTEQLELSANSATNMSAAPSSTGYTAFNADMNALSVGTQDWDSFVFADELQDDLDNPFDFSLKQDQSRPPPALHKKTSSSTVIGPASGEDISAQADSDPPIQSSLLYFLLLCGAFFASEPSPSNSSDLLRIPADIRTVAPAVLTSLLQDPTSIVRPFGPAPSSSQHERGTPAASRSARGPDRLANLHDRLTSSQPSQDIESAFSLTQSQYASIAHVEQDMEGLPTATDVAGSNSRSSLDTANGVSRQPRTTFLSETLAAMQSRSTAFKDPSAEVYTRSLLWEQIPTEVVKQFKEMVRDYDFDAGRKISLAEGDTASANAAVATNQPQIPASEPSINDAEAERNVVGTKSRPENEQTHANRDDDTEMDTNHDASGANFESNPENRGDADNDIRGIASNRHKDLQSLNSNQYQLSTEIAQRSDSGQIHHLNKDDNLQYTHQLHAHPPQPHLQQYQGNHGVQHREQPYQPGMQHPHGPQYGHYNQQMLHKSHRFDHPFSRSADSAFGIKMELYDLPEELPDHMLDGGGCLDA